MKTYSHPIEAAGALGPSLPSHIILSEFAPLKLWQRAWKASATNPAQRFRMGAVIFDEKERILSTGFSHILDNGQEHDKNYASIHAEHHALIQAAHLNLEGSTCMIVGLNKKGNGCPWSCCSCGFCAHALMERGIKQIIYPERTCTGTWTVKMTTPQKLLEGKILPTVEETESDTNKLFARHARLTPTVRERV